MKLKTRDFGEIEIDERDIITFEGPIFGFEGCREFVFLYQEDVNRHFVWLQSTEEPELCFIMVEPGLAAGDYRPELPADATRLLGDGEYMCWLLVVVKEPFEASTVNLKSPVVVNPALRRAAQVILDEDLPIRSPLFGEREGRTC